MTRVDYDMYHQRKAEHNYLSQESEWSVFKDIHGCGIKDVHGVIIEDGKITKREADKIVEAHNLLWGHVE